MTSITFYLFFVPILVFILLLINLILAPHNPYFGKNGAFECGFTSFLGQNRTQFSVSFFIFALLFLLFDLEILLVYPYLVSSYTNELYGLIILLLFLLALTLGFAFELGKKALSFDSRQNLFFKTWLSNLNMFKSIPGVETVLLAKPILGAAGAVVATRVHYFSITLFAVATGYYLYNFIPFGQPIPFTIPDTNLKAYTYDDIRPFLDWAHEVRTKLDYVQNSIADAFAPNDQKVIMQKKKLALQTSKEVLDTLMKYETVYNDILMSDRGIRNNFITCNTSPLFHPDDATHRILAEYYVKAASELELYIKYLKYSGCSQSDLNLNFLNQLHNEFMYNLGSCALVTSSSLFFENSPNLYEFYADAQLGIFGEYMSKWGTWMIRDPSKELLFPGYYNGFITHDP